MVRVVGKLSINPNNRTSYEPLNTPVVAYHHSTNNKTRLGTAV